jgi:acyl homoserine lactone synthase
MIRFIYADNFYRHTLLRQSMFEDRTAQFKNRLDWEVSVDERGWEIDEYDSRNPLYIVWEQEDGRHGGSIRVMPTTGRIMTNDHFLHLTGGVHISSPLICEGTRFCLAPGARTGVAAAILAAGLEFGLRSGYDQALGVIYERTLPIYRRIGWIPDVVGTSGEGRDRICVVLWNFDVESRNHVAEKAGIPLCVLQRWYDRSFGACESFSERMLPAEPRPLAERVAA